MITQKMKLLALATASTILLTGCGDNTAEGIKQDVQDARNAKTHIQGTKQSTATRMKKKLQHGTAEGLDKAADGLETGADKLHNAAEYTDSESEL